MPNTRLHSIHNPSSKLFVCNPDIFDTISIVIFRITIISYYMNIYLKTLFMITKCYFIYIIQLLRSVEGKLKILEEISFVDFCSCETFQPSLQRQTIYLPPCF